MQVYFGMSNVDSLAAHALPLQRDFAMLRWLGVDSIKNSRGRCEEGVEGGSQKILGIEGRSLDIVTSGLVRDRVEFLIRCF